MSIAVQILFMLPFRSNALLALDYFCHKSEVRYILQMIQLWKSAHVIHVFINELSPLEITCKTVDFCIVYWIFDHGF